MKTSIYVSIPTLGSMHPAAVNSFYAHANAAAAGGVRLEIAYTIDDSVIMRARSEAVSEFYFRTTHTHYFHISDDIEICFTPTPEDNIFTRLLSSGNPFVGALYSRTAFPQQCTSVALDGGAVTGVEQGLTPVKYLSGGIWLLKRDVVRKMVKAYPELEYASDPDKRRCFALFLESLVQRPDGTRKLLTEDYAFCERWSALGGKIYADTSIRTRHYGLHGFQLPTGKG